MAYNLKAKKIGAAEEYEPSHNVKDIIDKINTILPKMTHEEKNRMLKHVDYFKDKVFNRCWPYLHIPYYEKILYPFVNEHFPKKKKIKYLQIGIFEGLSMLYLTQNIFENYDLDITVIDNFSTEQYFHTEKTFDFNTKNIKLRKLKMDSYHGLMELINNGETFDFIYNSGTRRPDLLYNI